MEQREIKVICNLAIFCDNNKCTHGKPHYISSRRMFSIMFKRYMLIQCDDQEYFPHCYHSKTIPGRVCLIIEEVDETKDM